jgi:outer membrane protein assembly factor BamB
MSRFYALVLLLLAAPLVLAGDWPQWLGARRDGTTTEKIPVWKETPKQVWSEPAGEGYSVPVVADGRVFVHARVAGKQAEELFALDAKTGKELWRKSYARAPFNSFLNTGPQATPCVVEGKVYTYGITGVLTCFDAKTGDQVWQQDVFKKLDVKLPRFGVTCSPLVQRRRRLRHREGRDRLEGTRRPGQHGVADCLSQPRQEGRQPRSRFRQRPQSHRLESL